MKRSLPFASSSSSFRFGSRLTLAAASWLCVLVLGCSRQAEGERCDTNNNNEDCESGLVCTQLRTTTGGSVGAVCCPETNQTAEVCQRFPLDFGDDPETEGTDTESTDTESEGESPSESTTDESTAEETSSESSVSEAGAVVVEAGALPVEASVAPVDGSTP